MDVENNLNDEKPAADELCRLCANTAKQFFPIFQGEGIEHNISQQIKRYLPIIRVTKVDKLPLQICYQCTTTLLAWHSFFEECRVADNRLREILSVDVEFNKDDDSCHDYADDFRDDFDDQPTVCDNTREKGVLFDSTSDNEMTEIGDNTNTSKNANKSVRENLSDNRCVARAGRKRVPLAAKRRLSPSVKEERAKIVKSKKIRLLDCATATAAKSETASQDAVAGSSTSAAAPSTLARGKSDSPKGKGRSAKGKAESASPSRTRQKKTAAKAEKSAVKETATKADAKSAASKAKETAAKPAATSAITEASSPRALLEDVAEENLITEPDPFVIDCDDCQFATNSMLAMQRHCRLAHPKQAQDEPNVCHHCNYTCKRKYDIKRHIINVHLPHIDSDLEVLTCGICWHSFTTKSALRRHMARRHFSGNQNETASAAKQAKDRWNRGFCCDICGRGYETQREMLGHREVYHATAQPMRWSTFQSSKGKLKHCLECRGNYRAGRFFDDHTCISKEDTAVLEERIAELLRTKPGFRCDICSLAFMWKPIYRQHREVTHADATPLNWDELEAVEVPYYCACCCMAFDEEEAVAQHVCVKTALEVEPKSHVCPLCGGSYQRKSDYRRHRRIRHGIVDEDGGAESADAERRKPLIQCPYCDTSAMTRTQMVKHIKTVHDIETESPFLCVICNKVFKRKATLDTHNQVYHPQGENATENERVLSENQILLNGETAYHCNMCNRNMFNAIRFLAHHRLHFAERKFTCDLCGKQTRTQHQLNTHIKIIHLNIRNYECDICSKSFHSKQSCEEHRRIHTGERPFSCEICGKTFIAMNALFTHKKFHDDFFAHACHLCPKKFKVRRSLTNHIRTHTGERPFQCDMCSKTFNNSSRFSYHKKVTHSDNRPHKCDLCGSRFKANKFLLRHMKLHKTRTHIQFRRRNNPEYFAAQDAAAAVAAEEASRNVDPEKGLLEIVNEDVKDPPVMATAKKAPKMAAKKAPTKMATVKEAPVMMATAKEAPVMMATVTEAPVMMATVTQAPVMATVMQPQIEYKIIESGAPMPTTIGSIVYCDSMSTAAAVISGGKCYANMVDVSLQFAQNDQLQNENESFRGDAAAVQATSYPPSSAT